MEIDVADLPDTVETLRALLIATRAEVATAKAEISQVHVDREQLAKLEAERIGLETEVARLQAQAARYEHIIAQLRRLQFGTRSERMDKDQLKLAFEDLLQGLADVEHEQEKPDPELKAHRTRERREKRPSLPDHLPRIERIIEPEAQACKCCGGRLHVIGEDVSQRLDVVPAQYQVIVTRRPKYACRSCEGMIVQAPAPPRLIEGGLPTERLVAQVLVDKYADPCSPLSSSSGLCAAGCASRSVDSGLLGRLRRGRAQADLGTYAPKPTNRHQALRR